MAGAGAGLDDLAVGEHAHGGAACADGAACVTRKGPFTLPSPGGQAAAGELQRWPGYLTLKSSKFCQGHPHGADQCLNDKRNRKIATRGYNTKQFFFCKPCADEACAGYMPMTDVKTKMCAVEGCSTQPKYGASFGKEATHCSIHGKELGMKDVKHDTCAFAGCPTRPSYGADSDKGATHCSTHGKPLGMKNLVIPTCVVEGCTKASSYGADHEKGATHCSPHGKPLGMTDVRNARCAVYGCSTVPCYGYRDGPPTHCAEHGKPFSMTNVRSAQCAVEGCLTQPCYGANPGKTATHCAGHGKKIGMANVGSKTCAVDDCPTIPCYGDRTGKPATHCAEHGNDLGMKNVTSPTCAVEGCSTRPSYGENPDEGATHCAAHGKPIGMTNVRQPTCCVAQCTTQPSYPWAPYCAVCYADLHPDDPLVQAHNKTEAKIKMFLNDSLDAGISSLSTFNAINVCGNRAPAWMRQYEFDFVILGERGIIHCDGDQHKRDVARFKTKAADQIENDVSKSVLVLDRGLFEVRIDQDDTWRDRCDWRKLLTGMLAFGVTRKLAGEATCVVGRRDEADLSYAPYVDAMLQTPHADRVYEAFLTPNERDMLTVIHRASGARTHWRIPSDFKLARWPDADAAPTAPAVPTQLTIEGAFKRRKVA
jgi:hypothetical protein